MSKRKIKASETAVIEDLKKKIRIARSKGNFVEVADFHNALGNQYRLLGNFEDALEQHQEEAQVSKVYNKKDKMGLGIAYRNIGEVYIEMKNKLQAISYIKQYLKIAKEVDNYVEQQRAYITLGRAYFLFADDSDGTDESSEVKGNFADEVQKAYNYIRQAYLLLKDEELKKQVKDVKELMLMKCNNCLNLGMVFEMMGKLNEAATWLNRAVEVGLQYKFHDNLMPCYTLLCTIYLKTNKPKEALHAAQNAAKSCKALGNHGLEVEPSLLEAKALFAMNEVENGKKILKKLRQKVKKKPDLHFHLEELEPLLIAAVKICRTQDALFIAEDTDYHKRMTLHEILGDNYTSLGNYQEAISHYKKSYLNAQKMGITGKKLARLYFSVAESYKDLEQFEKAYEYYQKEMVIHNGNVVEEFKTQTNIALVLEKMKKPTKEVIAAHESAIAFAKLSKSLSKQVTAITNFGLYLKSIDNNAEAEKQLNLAERIGRENNIVDDDEPDSQDLLDEDDDVDLDDLSAEEDSDDEADDGKRKKGFSLRRNEAGETTLHLAAKKGELRQVARLIRMGHPTNVKDNANWTPVHEAANFGHAAVVEELAKHRADVNVFGGMDDRVTPLHDAAGNGHCDVIRVLLKYGAKVLAKDKKGLYPIDHLISWRHSEEGKNASESQLEAYEEMKTVLKERMAQAGKIYGREDEKKMRKVGATRNKSPTMTLLVEKDQDYDCPIPVTITTDTYDPDQEGEGTKLYRNTIKHLRRTEEAPKFSKKQRPREISPGPQGSLIPEVLDVHNDWLLPDDTITTKKNEMIKLSSSSSVPPSKPKRKRDSFEDSHQGGQGRSRRRRTSSGTRRRSTCEDIASHVEDGLMDVDMVSENEVRPSSRQSGVASVNSVRLDLDDDILSDAGANSFIDDDLEMPPGEIEDFLPSQRPPSSTIEFGRTLDIPVVEPEESSDEEDRLSPVYSSTRRNPSVINVSSDEDDDFNIRPSRTKVKKQRLSELADKFKKSSTIGNFSGGKGQRSMVQSRLPVQVITKPRAGRNSDGNSDSGVHSPELRLRRPPSSSSLTSTLNLSGEQRKQDVWRLKIKVLDLKQTLLVPVDERHQNETVDWLASECASRYMRQHGMKPLLTLQTKDGAMLTGSDPLSLVLGETERELDAVVAGFDQEPLIDRYISACAETATDQDPGLTSCLNMCQSSNVLDVSDFNLRGKAGVVLMKALQRQTSLQTLTLSGCNLFDNGVLEFCKVLPTLPNLKELDLSSNGISITGFTALSEVFQQENLQNEPVRALTLSVPVGLTKLKLSHNPLGNSAGKALSLLLDRLTALKSLELVDCNFTEKLFTWNSNDIRRAFSCSRSLEEVDISYNKLKSVGLEKFLQSLPARKMKSVRCSSCALNSGDTSAEVIARSICSFLSQNEDCCNLKVLALNDCGLNDKAVNMILGHWDRLVRLEKLEMARNDGLTAASLVRILDRSREAELPLTELDMGSIPNLWDCPDVTDEIILHAIENKMSSDQKLLLLRLPSGINDPRSCDSEMDKGLSKLETRIITLMEDFAGNTNFRYEKCGASITYRFD